MSRFLLMALLVAAIAACGGGGGGVVGGGGGPPPALNAPHVPDQILVGLDDPDDQDEIDELLAELSGVTITRIGLSSFFILQLQNGTDLETLLDQLEDDLIVIQSEPNYVAEAPEGDPGNIRVLGGDLLASIRTQPAYAPLDLAAAHLRSTGDGVVVAIVDSGVDFDQPFLQGRLEGTGFDFLDRDFDPTDERNFTDDDGDGLVDEQFGHGTFVASQVLAVAPDARILPVRILDDEGYATAAALAAGIIWAVDAGADVINISATLPLDSDAVGEAIEHARDNDVVIVGAAGNDGTTDVSFPARFSDVVGVAAADADGFVAPFSNVGSKIRVVAPGVDLIGAVPTSLSSNGTARWSGTSFATPIVAGTAALVRAAFPELNREEIATHLRETALPLDTLNPAHAGRLGDGLVQPLAAVETPPD